MGRVLFKLIMLTEIWSSNLVRYALVLYSYSLQLACSSASSYTTELSNPELVTHHAVMQS